MKTRSKDRVSNKPQQSHPAADEHTRTTTAVVGPDQNTTKTQVSPASSHHSPSLLQSQGIQCTVNAQPSTVTPSTLPSDQSAVAGKFDPQPMAYTHNVHATMADSQMMNSSPVSSVATVGCVTPERHASPVHLTVLGSSDISKTSPPSDQNHNVPAMYVVSPSGSLQFPQTSSYGAKDLGYSDPSVSAGYVTQYHYYDLDGGSGINGHGVYPPSTEPYLYSKDGLYPSQYMYPDQVCKTYNFTTPDSGREYSSPELASFNHGLSSNSTAYTSPIPTSTTSASPDSGQWSSEDQAFASTRDAMTDVRLNQPGALPQETMHESEKGLPANQHASLHTAYGADEHSLADDSMRDIERDILRSDLHSHIYFNYSQASTYYEESEESLDATENETPSRGSAPAKSANGSKKRRRRTQTPVQRTAANMRERKRMCHLNVAFDSLKDRLPNVRSRKKLSRIQTLKAAIFYIGLLTECLQSS